MSRNSTALSSSTASTSNAAPSASGLEVLGIPGRDYLREALTSCSDPLQAIENYADGYSFFDKSLYTVCIR